MRKTKQWGDIHLPVSSANFQDISKVYKELQPRAKGSDALSLQLYNLLQCTTYIFFNVSRHF